jgi:hypothetical protein
MIWFCRRAVLTCQVILLICTALDGCFDIGFFFLAFDLCNSFLYANDDIGWLGLLRILDICGAYMITRTMALFA